MNNKQLVKRLYKTRKTLLEVCQELGLDIDSAEYYPLDQCSNCSIWFKFTELEPDLDGNPICKVCDKLYGK